MGSSCLRIFHSTNDQELTHGHGVFLSFGGETRYRFTSHLRGALMRRHIETYVDFNLERGNEISTTLVSAIRGAIVSVIVFSKNTAASKWCMEEIAEIMECKRKGEQIVLPIFYHVDPTDVRHQTGVYAEAFSAHLDNKENVGKVPRWRDALREAANLCGWHCSANQIEYDLVECIAEDVRTKLNCYRHQMDKTGDDLETMKIMLCKLYRNNVMTLEQILHVWEKEKAANLTKDIAKARKQREETMRIIERAYKK